ncbi:MAG: hypothetical protein J6O13_16170 [Selenomonas sp.]|nr:hypothetical protein [Selenomonas sp.]
MFSIVREIGCFWLLCFLFACFVSANAFALALSPLFLPEPVKAKQPQHPVMPGRFMGGEKGKKEKR